MSEQSLRVLVCIVIDPNVRVRGNQTYACFDDVEMPHDAEEVAVGQKVLAVERESDMEADAIVADIDREHEFIYLTVDWSSWRSA